jgi:hypothetical protein
MKTLLVIIVTLIVATATAQVKIGNNPNTVNANSLLELESDTKGFLLPRLTASQILAMNNPPVGMIIFNLTDSSLYLRRDTGWTIVPLASNANSKTLYWSNSSAGNIYNSNTGKVGIGTGTPVARLHVADSSVVFTANGYPPSPYGNPPVSSTGRRMMWYPGKAAFRAGYVDGTYWDKDSIGLLSFAVGLNTRAKGPTSFAAGSGTLAGGDGSTAMGLNTQAKGNYSIAIGYATIASASHSVALGNETIASGPASTALGTETIASGYLSTAIGLYSTASGYLSTAIGLLPKASGYASLATGAMTEAKGSYSSAAGYYTIAKGLSSTVLGMYNDSILTSDESSSVSLVTPLLIVGNGNSHSNRSNAFVVRKNGDAEVTGKIRQANYSQAVTIPASSNFNFTWTHNLGYQPVIMIALDQTGGGFLDYCNFSYGHNNINEVRIYLTNRNTTNAATGTVRWIVVY